MIEIVAVIRYAPLQAGFPLTDFQNQGIRGNKKKFRFPF
jgi:hypothetical protein